MPVPEAESYIPETNDLLCAFDVIKARHPNVATLTAAEFRQAALERDLGRVLEAGVAGADFITASVGFLANKGHDEITREIGTEAWWAINQAQMRLQLVDDMIAGPVLNGVRPESAIANFRGHDQFHFFAIGMRIGETIIGTGTVFIPPEFLEKVQNKPWEALSDVASICSFGRDIANGRVLTDPQGWRMRRPATQAHVLLEAIRQHPEIELGSPYLEIVRDFPNGIDSLPEHLKYRVPRIGRG